MTDLIVKTTNSTTIIITRAAPATAPPMIPYREVFSIDPVCGVDATIPFCLPPGPALVVVVVVAVPVKSIFSPTIILFSLTLTHISYSFYRIILTFNSDCKKHFT